MPDDLNVLDVDRVKQLVASVPRQTCDEYASAFAKERSAASGGAANWDVLTRLTELWLAHDPGPKDSFHNLDFIADLDDVLLKAVANAAKLVGDPELIARCCDVYWVRRATKKRERSDFEYARAAVDAYVSSALTLENADNWPACVERLERALTLARQLNLKAERSKTLVTVTAMLDRHAGRDPLFLSHRLMEILLDEDSGDPAACIAFCDTAAAGAEAEAARTRNPDTMRRSRQYLELRMRWMERGGMTDDVPGVWARIAQGCEVAATYCVPDRYSIAAHHQQSAVEALRRAKVPKEKVDAAHQVLLDYQLKAVSQFRSTTTTIDLTEIAKAAIDRVEGKGFTEALLGLLDCVTPPRLKQYQAWVQREESVIARLLPVVQLSKEGKPIAARGAVTGADDDSTYSEIVSRARQSQTFLARGSIIPALRVFNAEHPLRSQDVEQLIADSPLVEDSRRTTMTRGLLAGFQGDWLVVAHVLPPQLEHIVRQMFVARGFIVSGLDSQGIQKEHDLNTLLWRPEADQIFGPDWLLDIRCSLVHPFGANLRNRMAHGLMDDGEFYRLEVIYLWWLTLRMVMLHTSFTRDALAEARRKAEAAAPAEAPAAPGVEPGEPGPNHDAGAVPDEPKTV